MMIGKPENTEHSVEKVTVGKAVAPVDAYIVEDGQGPRSSDRSTDSWSDTNAIEDKKTTADLERDAPSEGEPHHPYAGLFEIAIDGAANLAAHYVRQGLGRIVVLATTSTVSKKSPTAAEEPSSPSPAENKHGLLIAVFAAAIATAVLWLIIVPKKNSAS